MKSSFGRQKLTMVTSQLNIRPDSGRPRRQFRAETVLIEDIDALIAKNRVRREERHPC